METLKRCLFGNPNSNQMLREFGVSIFAMSIAILLHATRIPLVSDDLHQNLVGVATGFALGYVIHALRANRPST